MHKLFRAEVATLEGIDAKRRNEARVPALTRMPEGRVSKYVLASLPLAISNRTPAWFSEPTMTQIDRVLLAAHKGNVRRYRRILDTYLTDFERQFVEHRLYEEEDAIAHLLSKETVEEHRLAG
jgi:hypothetical protein